MAQSSKAVTWTNQHAASLVIGLSIPKLLIFVRQELAKGNSVSWMTKKTKVTVAVEKYYKFEAPVRIRQAYASTVFKQKPEILAKRILSRV